MADVNDSRFTQQNQQSTQYVEQLLADVRRISYVLTSPTARDICSHAISLLETGWLVERQGGVISDPQQQQQQLQQYQSRDPSFFGMRGAQGSTGTGPQNNR